MTRNLERLPANAARIFGRTVAALAVLLLMTSCSELEYLQAKTVVQEGRIRELETSLEQWKDAYDQLRQQKVTENGEFEKALTLRDQEIRRLRTIRSDNERRLEADSQELKLRLQKEIDLNAKMRLQMKGDSDTARGTIASYKKQLELAEAKRKKAESDFAGANIELKKLRPHAEAADRARAAAEQRLKAVESEREQLKSTLDDRNRKINEYEQTIASLQKRVKNASDSEGGLAKQVETLKNQLADEKRLADVERKKKSDEIARLKSQLAGRTGSGGAKDPALVKAQGELAKLLAAQIKSKTAEVEGTGSRVAVRLQSDLLFERATVLLTKPAQTLLRQIADVLNKYPAYQLRIEGHTDNEPVRNMPFPDNLALSSQRADNVLRFLMDATKLPHKQIRSAGCSYWIPLASNNTVEGRQRNRRVEIILMHEE